MLEGEGVEAAWLAPIAACRPPALLLSGHGRSRQASRQTGAAVSSTCTQAWQHRLLALRPSQHVVAYIPEVFKVERSSRGGAHRLPHRVLAAARVRANLLRQGLAGQRQLVVAEDTGRGGRQGGEGADKRHSGPLEGSGVCAVRQCKCKCKSARGRHIRQLGEQVANGDAAVECSAAMPPKLMGALRAAEGTPPFHHHPPTHPPIMASPMQRSCLLKSQYSRSSDSAQRGPGRQQEA